jgi:hypothetical protein
MTAPRSLDKLLAAVCARCPVCRRARKNPGSLAAKIVERAETAICPFCRAYERVHGQKASGRQPSLSEGE